MKMIRLSALSMKGRPITLKGNYGCSKNGLGIKTS